MHSWSNSIRKRLHSQLVNPGKVRQQWSCQYWQSIDGFRDISCSQCPKYNKADNRCLVSFGSHLRKCVVASTEAHLFDSKDKEVLEIGFGRFSLGRNLVVRSGGRWTGIDPKHPKAQPPELGHGGLGMADNLPFPDATFDMVFGIQSLEHWGQKTRKHSYPTQYPDCLHEIYRVLKPGGEVYLDAPIHLHGHEMFIMGDIPRIKSLFANKFWSDLTMERWRYHYEPLERHAPTPTEVRRWPAEIDSYTPEEVEVQKDKHIWLLALTASKRAA